MAVFPCDVCGAIYKGPQQTMYPALFLGTSTVRVKQRMCPNCFANANEFSQELLVPIDGRTLSRGCTVCEDDLAPFAFFVTVYATGEERVDYFGQLCSTCVSNRVATRYYGLPARAEAAWLLNKDLGDLGAG